MTDAGISQATGVTSVLARFPEATGALRRLALADPGFRALCDEYALAQASLAGFEARPDAAQRAEVAEYRTVIVELECEIGRLLREARP